MRPLTDRSMRLSCALALALALVAAASPVAAQRVLAAPRLSAGADADSSAREKSRAVAILAGTIFPGSAHWYACESTRGWGTALVYWTGVAVVQGGRTDTVGKVGGAALLGALAFSIIDGARAIGRHNDRARAGLPTSCLRRAP